MNAEYIINKINKLNEIQYGGDGFVYYVPARPGLIAAWELRVIADELDRRNADWKAQIDKELGELK